MAVSQISGIFSLLKKWEIAMFGNFKNLQMTSATILRNFILNVQYNF